MPKTDEKKLDTTIKASHWLFTAQGHVPPVLDHDEHAHAISIKLLAHVEKRIQTFRDLGYRVRYSIFSVETAPKTGMMHAQGYIEFKKQHRMSALKRVAQNWHWEPRMGTREQARDYCSKEDTRFSGPYSEGLWIKGKGARVDVDEFAIAIIEDGLPSAIEEAPGMYLRYAHNAHLLAERQLVVPAMRDVKVHCLWGGTGVGKTHRAMKWAEDCGLPW